jgi:adenine deaminase
VGRRESNILLGGSVDSRSGFITPFPLCGVTSLKPMEIVGEEVRKLEESLRMNGVRWEKPILTIDTLGTPAIPHLKMTQQSHVNLKDRKILPLEV